MRKLLIVFCIFMLSYGNVFSRSTEKLSQLTRSDENLFSENVAKISLLTCSSGDQLYSSFGHTGIRVKYCDGADVVYNFGVFDFETPNFYIKFIRGKLQYMLEVGKTCDFIDVYEIENRTICEQKLVLTETQAAAIIDRLNYLYRPENRYYSYSSLYKNCTTEPRNIIFENLGIDTSSLNAKTDESYRELLNCSLTGWSRWGVNLILGSSCDKKVTVFQSMFLPAKLHDGLENIDKSQKIILKRAFLSESSIIKSTRNPIPPFIYSPCLVFGLLFLLFLFFAYWGGLPYWGQVLHFLIGLLGLVVALISLFTEHTELHNNYNLLWCNPLFLLLALASVFKWEKIRKIVFYFLLVMLIVTPFIWLFGVQDAELSFVFIVCTLVVSLVQTKMKPRSRPVVYFY